MPFDAADITNPVIELLQTVRTMLTPRDAWVKGTRHMRFAGRDTWCLVGAICQTDKGDPKATLSNLSTTGKRALQKLAENVSRFPADRSADTVIVYNDSKNVRHHDILNALDTTIHTLTQGALEKRLAAPAGATQEAETPLDRSNANDIPMEAAQAPSRALETVA